VLAGILLNLQSSKVIHRTAAKTGSHDRLPAMICQNPRGLLWSLHDNPYCRDCERSADGGNGLAIQIVVGVIA
jgi:hypothetical protein